MHPYVHFLCNAKKKKKQNTIFYPSKAMLPLKVTIIRNYSAVDLKPCKVEKGPVSYKSDVNDLIEVVIVPKT